jgi:adenylate kinase
VFRDLGVLPKSQRFYMYSPSLPRLKTLLILGKPGGGKGTISKKIITSFPGTTHLSTGDILRDNVRNKTEIGLKAKSYMDKGGLVPDDIVISLVSNRLNEP